MQRDLDGNYSGEPPTGGWFEVCAGMARALGVRAKKVILIVRKTRRSGFIKINLVSRLGCHTHWSIPTIDMSKHTDIFACSEATTSGIINGVIPNNEESRVSLYFKFEPQT